MLRKRKIKKLLNEILAFLYEICDRQEFDGEAIDCVCRRIYRIKNLLRIDIDDEKVN